MQRYINKIIYLRLHFNILSFPRVFTIAIPPDAAKLVTNQTDNKLTIRMAELLIFTFY